MTLMDQLGKKNNNKLIKNKERDILYGNIRTIKTK